MRRKMSARSMRGRKSLCSRIRRRSHDRFRCTPRKAFRFHPSRRHSFWISVDAWCESETWLQRCECLASASAWCAHSMPTLMSPGLLEQHQLLSVSSERFRGFKEGYSVIRQTKSWVVGSGRPDARKLAISDFELTMTRVPISPAESFAAEAMLGTTRVSGETLIKTKQKRLRPRMARGK